MSRGGAPERENQDFVGVMPECPPSLTHEEIGFFGLGATTGGLPLQRMKQPGRFFLFFDINIKDSEIKT